MATKFEEFDTELGPTIERVLPGSLCTKITLVFVDADGAQCCVGFVRDGFQDPDDVKDPVEVESDL